MRGRGKKGDEGKECKGQREGRGKKGIREKRS
jgi:hypothetical protein